MTLIDKLNPYFKERQNPLSWLTFGLLFLLTLLGGNALEELRQFYYLRMQDTNVTTGMFESIETSTHDEGTNYTCEFTYSANNKTYKRRESFTANVSEGFNIGGPAMVTFNPENPEISTVYGNAIDNRMPFIGMLLLASMGIIIGSVILWFRQRSEDPSPVLISFYGNPDVD